jgi:hypothetical protein
MPRWEVLEIPSREAYLDICRNDEGRKKRSGWVFFSSLTGWRGFKMLGRRPGMRFREGRLVLSRERDWIKTSIYSNFLFELP